MTINDLECFKKTSDYWCGNYYKDLVQVSLLYNNKGIADRVVVSGNDDMMMAYDGTDALEVFLKILQVDSVTQELLKELKLRFE